MVERSGSYRPPFHYFFGTGTMKLDARPDRLITARESITAGGLDLALIPAPSGETPDALSVHDRTHDILFVGDAFMPSVGAPFVAEARRPAERGQAAANFCRTRRTWLSMVRSLTTLASA